jgi:hypothetical protein
MKRIFRGMRIMLAIRGNRAPAPRADATFSLTQLLHKYRALLSAILEYTKNKDLVFVAMLSHVPFERRLPE